MTDKMKNCMLALDKADKVNSDYVKKVSELNLKMLTELGIDPIETLGELMSEHINSFVTQSCIVLGMLSDITGASPEKLVTEHLRITKNLAIKHMVDGTEAKEKMRKERKDGK